MTAVEATPLKPEPCRLAWSNAVATMRARLNANVTLAPCSRLVAEGWWLARNPEPKGVR